MAEHIDSSVGSVGASEGDTGTSFNWLAIASGLLAIIGLTIVLYPLAAQWLNQYRQAQIVNAYDKMVHASPVQPSKQLQEAREYNHLLSKDLLVDIKDRIPNVRQAQGSPSEMGVESYDKQLVVNSSGLMGRILVPAADADLPIYHGASDASLLQGAGHLQGTALPVGGVGTRTVITAHRGLADAAMFTYLDRVKKGDTFSLDIFGEVLVYKVFDIQVVAPNDSQTIKPVPGRDLATLITCTPLGLNTHRIVVTGERLLPAPKADVKKITGESELPRFPWWLVAWVAGILFSLWFMWFMNRKPKQFGVPKHMV